MRHMQLIDWTARVLDIFCSKQRTEAILRAIYYRPFWWWFKRHAEDTRLFRGMPYRYHADALQNFPTVDYLKLKKPFLLVAGTKDPGLLSADVFAKKAARAGVPIIYWRIVDMPHYILERPDVIEKSFAWLRDQLVASARAN